MCSETKINCDFDGGDLKCWWARLTFLFFCQSHFYFWSSSPVSPKFTIFHWFLGGGLLPQFSWPKGFQHIQHSRGGCSCSVVVCIEAVTLRLHLSCACLNILMDVSISLQSSEKSVPDKIKFHRSIWQNQFESTETLFFFFFQKCDISSIETQVCAAACEFNFITNWFSLCRNQSWSLGFYIGCPWNKGLSSVTAG